MIRSTTPLNSCFSPIGKLDFYQALSRCLANSSTAVGLFEISIVAIQLVDDHEPGKLNSIDITPGNLRPHLHTGDRIDENQGAVHHAQGGDGFSDKIGIAGRIENIQLMIPELNRENTCI